MSIEGIDVGEKGAHQSRHPGTHVFTGKAGEVTAGSDKNKEGHYKHMHQWKCTLKSNSTDKL